MVEQVKELAAELQFHRFGDAEVLEHSRIEIPVARSPEGVAVQEQARRLIEVVLLGTCQITVAERAQVSKGAGKVVQYRTVRTGGRPTILVRQRSDNNGQAGIRHTQAALIVESSRILIDAEGAACLRRQYAAQ